MISCIYILGGDNIRQIFRDKKGQFTTKSKAFKVQEVVGDKWKKPKLIEEYEAIEEVEEFEEYEYFVGFDYQTPTVKSGKKTLMQHGKHDFKTEFRVTSPVPLSDNELKETIKNTYSDYGVLKNKDSYRVKSEVKRPRTEKPSLKVKFTKRIER